MKDETPVVVTANEVITKRQNELTVEIFSLDSQIADKLRELEALKLRRVERIMEHDMWENYSQRSAITVTTTTTVEMSTRMGQADKMKFDDCLKTVMREAGMPLRFGDIRNRLERFDYYWNNYASAHNYISRSGLLESAGKHGYYQLTRF